ncbi:hypothetical protein BDQ17DRAFT_739178 [Cyathus striatus]|nr:hypothetical protein BDQ17DRAFT_739178 [Cyathus striatus]
MEVNLDSLMHSQYMTRYLEDHIHLPYASFYPLLQGKNVIVLQAPAVISPSYRSVYDPEEDRRVEKEIEWTLQIIQTLLPSLKFGLTNWAYLIQDHEGVYHIQHRQKRLTSVTCQPWAPLVDENDVKISRWISCEEREGIWNNQHVDLLIGWNNETIKWINEEMNGHRLIQGLDLGFEVLGHITSNGNIIGIMKEPAIGRLVERCDKNVVYAAVSRLQRLGLIYEAILPSNIIIATDGKVRFLSVQNIVTFGSREHGENIEQAAQHFHWNQLKKLFIDLHRHWNIMPVTRSLTGSVKILPPLPTPPPPLQDPIVLLMVQWYMRKSTPTSSNRSRHLTSTRRRRVGCTAFRILRRISSDNGKNIQSWTTDHNDHSSYGLHPGSSQTFIAPEMSESLND